jgi:hypothetical protein
MTDANAAGQALTTFEVLFAPLETPLAQHETDHPAHHREIFHFKGFVRLLVYHFTKGCESGSQLLTDSLSAAPALGLPHVAHSTFFDAFQRFPSSWLAALLSYLLVAVAWKAIPELEALGKLYCVDGSLFPALLNMMWAEYTSQHRAIRLHLCFELNRMLAVQFLVEPGNSNEKKALLKMLEAGVTYMADRGYFSYPLLAAIVAAQAFFVFRAKVNLVYVRVEKLPVQLPASVQHLFRHVTDQRVCLLNAKGRPIYRLVSFQVSQERYLLLTNRLDLSTFQVILLYAYRWQVELIFRFLKRSLNGLHLLSQSQEGVTIHFYALLIAALLQLRLKQQCVEQGAPAPSTATAAAQTTPAPIAGLMIDPERLAGTRGHTFLATVGEKSHRYWKIGKHWLVTLRNYLAHPFTPEVVRALGRL